MRSIESRAWFGRLWPVLLLAGFAILFGNAVADRVKPTRSSESAGGSQDWLVTAPGWVEPISGEVRVDSSLTGRLVSVLVDSGDRIQRGMVVALLEDTEYRSRERAAAAEVSFRQSELAISTANDATSERRRAAESEASAELAAQSARDALDRLQMGDNDQPGASNQLAEARASYDKALAKLTAERHNLAVVRAMEPAQPPSHAETALAIAEAQWAEASAILDKTRIRSPLAGTVLERLKAPGEMVAEGSDDPILIVGDTSRLRVRAEIDPRDVARVQLGQRAFVTAEAFGARRFAGQVLHVGSRVRRNVNGDGTTDNQSVSESLPVIIELDPGTPLLPGMHVDAFLLAPADSSNQGAS